MHWVFYKYFHKYNHILLAILSSFSRVDSTKDKKYKRIVSGTSIGFPSRLDLSTAENVLSLDLGAWHRLQSELLGITCNILMFTSITSVRTACTGLRVTLPRFDDSLQERMSFHSINKSFQKFFIFN